jgi:hypothetical protein
MSMLLTEQELLDAQRFGETLRQLVDGQVLPPTNRTRAAGACFAIAHDHHHGVVVLFEETLYASAFALVRPIFEAYIRRAWLSLCATDLQIDGFLNDEDPPSPKVTGLVLGRGVTARLHNTWLNGSTRLRNDGVPSKSTGLISWPNVVLKRRNSLRNRQINQ